MDRSGPKTWPVRAIHHHGRAAVHAAGWLQRSEDGQTLYFRLHSDNSDGIGRMPLAGGDLERINDLAAFEVGDGVIHAALELGPAAVLVAITEP
ncbi:MAG TPA: hypothetical protein VHM19_01220 [Polyangiales bacterium]|nr:hypothetical protein [Polyangiales bacterium]